MQKKINKRIQLIVIFFSVLISNPVIGKMNIVGTSGFKNKVNHTLNEASSGSSYLRRLVKMAKQTNALITIKAITGDRSTWHVSGKKSRSHTKALDSLSRGAQRIASTDSVIYINVNRLTESHKSYKSGTFIHELVHAVDLARGNYHSNYSLREKRAVFFQNVWRHKHGKILRVTYHRRFNTVEYQENATNGTLASFVDYYFYNNDIPKNK